MTEISIPSGTNYADAIHMMVYEAFPGVSFRMKPTQYTTPCLVYREPEPWRDAEELACAIGMKLRHRRNRVTAYIPFGQRMAMARWRFISEPIKRARLRAHERLNPPVEYPDPDYGDWEDIND